MASTAADLIQRTKFKDASGADRETRVEATAMEWLLKAKDGKVYCIKFDKNFSKKHLYTSSKKQDKVAAEAEKQFQAAGGKGDKAAHLAAAQKSADEAKFLKQLGHRSDDEQAICTACGHELKRHRTGKGAPTPCKEPKAAGLCGCANFKSAYGDKRAAQKKPTENPLSGATTPVNSAIWLDRIPRQTFEQAVVDGIAAREAELAKATKAWDAKGEHVKWDFGPAQAGCILEVEKGKTIEDWGSGKKKGVEVVALKSTADAKKPVYTIVHFHATL